MHKPCSGSQMVSCYAVPVFPMPCDRATPEPLCQLSQVYPLESASDAHSRMESNRHFGKIVLSTEPL